MYLSPAEGGGMCFPSALKLQRNLFLQDFAGDPGLSTLQNTCILWGEGKRRVVYLRGPSSVEGAILHVLRKSSPPFTSPSS